MAGTPSVNSLIFIKKAVSTKIETAFFAFILRGPIFQKKYSGIFFNIKI
jgi:hypothetical protein